MPTLPLLTAIAAFATYHPGATTYECHVTSSQLAVDGDEATWAINRKKSPLRVCQAQYFCPPGFVTRDDGACALSADDEIGISSYMMAKNGAPCGDFLSADAVVSRPQTCKGPRCATPVVTWVFGGHHTPGATIFSPGTWEWELIDALAVGRGDVVSTGYIEIDHGPFDGYDQVLLGRDFDQPAGSYPDSHWNLHLICSL